MTKKELLILHDIETELSKQNYKCVQNMLTNIIDSQYRKNTERPDVKNYDLDYRSECERYSRHMIKYCEYVENKLNNFKSLPIESDAIQEALRNVVHGYNLRRGIADKLDNIYFSAWMDCFDWMTKE